MSGPCSGSGSYYKPGHNPAFYYTDVAATCRADDLPFTALDTDISADSLPTFSWVTPNLCNDTHWISSCPEATSQRVKAGDDFLAALIPRLTSMPSYLAGQTLILLTWDEGDGTSTKKIYCPTATQPSCHIATLAVSAYADAGAIDVSAQSLYSMLSTIEDVLGYPRLASVIDQPSMRPGLGF